MTIPSRPAPAPPGQRGLNAAAGANASLEQLRQQLQQQQLQQQRQHSQQHQNGGVQLLTIKLPPPPPNSRSINGGTPLLGSSLPKKNNNNNISNNNNSNNNSINHINNNSRSSSITRKFPQANVRYAPATSWDGSPFESTAAAASAAVSTNSGNSNGNFKKIPPPRPPPPKVLTNKKINAPAPPQSVNILNNIFNRKKSTKAPPAPSNNKSGRLTPAGVYGASTTSSSTTASHSSNSSHMTTATTYGSSNLNDWYSSSAFSASYSSLTTSTATSNTAAPNQQQEPQLISFDSPPSSPTFTQKSNSDCVSVDSFSSDSNFSSPNNGSGSQPESGFEDDFSARSRSTTSPLDPWETVDAFSSNSSEANAYFTSASSTTMIGTAPVRNLNSINTRIHSSSDNPLCNGKSLLPPAPSLAKPTIIKPKISQKPKAPKPPAVNNNLFSSNMPSVFEANPPSPPMPQYAPPPPPAETGAGGVVSLLDVISGKADALQLVGNDFKAPETPYGIALYNFDGVEDGDLSLREDEKIYLLKQVSEEWFYGRNRSGCEGIFPVNYIDVRVPLRSTSSVPLEATQMDISSNFTMQATYTTSTTTTIQRNNTKNTTVSCIEIPKVKCLYNFPAEVEGDLPLRENDLVTILYKINEDWLFGVVDGRQGQFPANFLEYVPANIPML